MVNDSQQPLDLIIVGAGITGIGMAAHVQDKCPGMTFAVIEGRERLGGTWDLFRYPGIRSDSDMYTLGYGFDPWDNDQTIAGADAILAYLKRIADRRGITPRIRFSQKAIAADWGSDSGLWTLTLRAADGSLSKLQTRFLFLGSGYYDYDNPHQADIPGLDSFKGTVIHPQFWPEDFDYSRKRVAVIGSGATAVTLVPSMAQKAAHVVMVQRTPSWMMSRPSRDKLANLLRRLLPLNMAARLIRKRNIWMQSMLVGRSREKPQGVAKYITDLLRKDLGEAWNARDFTPPYRPWEQRMCLVPDGDLFDALKAGSVSIATGEISTVDASGLTLKDGQRIDADVIVTATGLRLAAFGNLDISLDGAPANLSSHFYYRNCMFSNLPNLAALFGYLNAGWTLRVDLVADWLCRLFAEMERKGARRATPVLPGDHGLIEDNVFDAYSSGYLRRGRHIIPKSASTAPWRIGMDYNQDRKELRRTPIDDGVLKFEP